MLSLRFYSLPSRALGFADRSSQDPVVTMAGALITYRHAVTNDNPAFTPAAFKDAIYWAVNRYPCEETLHRLEDRLDNGDEFLCFLPWEDDAPPFTLEPKYLNE
jgi:hypothetical protein